MSQPEESKVHIPLSEKIKGIPGIFGIRVEEEPSFKVLEEDDEVEVRDYEPTLVAKTIVSGSRTEAMDEGFNRLAHFIFGGNADKEKIHMTNPVFEAKGLKNPLAISQEPYEGTTEPKWVIAFCIPKDKSMSEVPQPDDDRVIISQMPRRMVAVKRFSGLSSDSNLSEAEDELRRWIKASMYEVVSEPMFAQYDPPFTVPLLRRNEIQIEIK